MGSLKWKKQLSPDLVLQRLCESRTIIEGGVSTRSIRGDYERWLSVLATSFEDRSSSDAIKTASIRKAVVEKQSMTKIEFEGFYYKAKNEIGLSGKRYVVCLPVWGRSEYCKGQLKRSDVNIHLSPNKNTKTSKNIELHRAKQISDFKDIFATSFSDHRRYANVYCWVNATSASEAHELAHTALSEYVAAINFWDKRGQSWRIYSGLQRPISEFLLAPHGSVHFSDGKIAYDGFYYHEWHPNKSMPAARKLEFRKSVFKYANLLLAAADSSPWSDDARRALRLYNEAFSHHEPQNALLAGWRLLEHLSGPKQEGIDQKLLGCAGCSKHIKNMRLLVIICGSVGML